MKDLQLFQNSQFGQLRGHVDENGQPWFVARDVAYILDIQNIRQNLAELDADERGVCIIDTPGGSQEVATINEPGLYSLVLRSRKPEAKAFKRWITHEVIPSIRRTGGYLAAPADASPEEIMARALFVADDMIKRLKENKAALESKIETDRPKVIFADAVTASPKSILVRELAKYLKQNGVDIGQNRLFAWLREEGYIIRAIGSDYNEPTQKAMNLGLFEIKKHTFVHSDGCIDAKPSVRVTGKGQLYFVNKFLGGAKASSN